MLHTLKQQDSVAKTASYSFYGINGKLNADDDNCLAKSVTINTTRYFCKFNTFGIESGHLVNPWSMYSDETISNFKNTTLGRIGKTLQEYREVSSVVFELYTRYLETHKDLHYRQAERLALEQYE